MSLELRKSSNWWYGVFMENGQKTIVNLKVPITGKRPPKRTMQGDDEFEQSRGRAQAAYDVLATKIVSLQQACAQPSFGLTSEDDGEFDAGQTWGTAL